MTIINFEEARAKRLQAQEEADKGNETVDDFVAEMMEQFVSLMNEYGYDIIDDPDTLYDLYVMAEAMKAVMHRFVGERYYFQAVTEDVFKGLNPDIDVEDFFQQ